jgi:hypothetical protein
LRLQSTAGGIAPKTLCGGREPSGIRSERPARSHTCHGPLGLCDSEGLVGPCYVAIRRLSADATNLNRQYSGHCLQPTHNSYCRDTFTTHMCSFHHLTSIADRALLTIGRQRTWRVGRGRVLVRGVRWDRGSHRAEIAIAIVDRRFNQDLNVPDQQRRECCSRRLDGLCRGHRCRCVVCFAPVLVNALPCPHTCSGLRHRSQIMSKVVGDLISLLNANASPSHSLDRLFPPFSIHFTQALVTSSRSQSAPRPPFIWLRHHQCK